MKRNEIVCMFSIRFSTRNCLRRAGSESIILGNFCSVDVDTPRRPAGDEDGDRPVDKDRYGYEAVKKWTAKGKIDVFEKDLIIVPINEQ